MPLTHQLVRRLTTRAAQLGITVNTVIQGAWGLTLSRLTGRREVVFGATVSGRPPQLPGVDQMVGLFINSIPVRVDCEPGMQLSELLRDLQDRQADLLDYHYIGLPDIHRAAGVDTLFDTLVVFESFPVDHVGLSEATEAAGLQCSGLTPVTGTHYPLTVTADVDPTLQLSLQYQHGAFEAAEVTTMAERLARVLAQFAATPRLVVRDVDVLTDSERRWVLAELNATATETAATTVPAEFARQVADSPHDPALIAGEVELSYAELDERAEAVARGLVERGVGPESLVAVALPRTADLVVALLGVLKAGAAYLPIDPQYPGHRLKHILGSAHPALVVSEPDVAAALPLDALPQVQVAELAGPDTARANSNAPLPDNTAYVMYTSGSTGIPKGVMITHRAITNSIPVLVDRLGLRRGRVLAQASINFDVSVFEILATLCTGGCVELVRDVLVLAERGAWSGDVISTVPSAFAEVLDSSEGRLSAASVTFAGERLPAALVRRVRRALPAARISNGYGQTETLYATTHVVGETDRAIRDPDRQAAGQRPGVRPRFRP